MKIKTKYNKGDIVYYFNDVWRAPDIIKDEAEAEPYKFKILDVSIHVKDKETYSVEYVLENMGNQKRLYSFYECDLYSSIEEYNSRYEPLLKEAIKRNDTDMIVHYAEKLNKKVKVIVED